MLARFGIVASLAFAAAVLVARDSNACSCAPPDSQLLAPDRVDDAPLNTKIRVEVAAYGSSPPRTVLRVHGGAEVAVKARTIRSGSGSVAVVELTPDAPLAASTQYEIATVDASHHPPNRVVGTFKTGTTSADTTAPKIDRIGRVFTTRYGSRVMTSCSVSSPWITAEDLDASDPGRPNAQLLYGVWVGDASGKIDETKPPNAILRSYEHRLTIGRASVCDPHDVALPTTAFAWIGIAANVPRDDSLTVVPKPVVAPPIRVVDDVAPGAIAEVTPMELAISASKVCVRLDGKVHCGDGDPDVPLASAPVVRGIEDATSLSVARDFGCVSTRRGTVQCWGSNARGQLGARLRAERSEDAVAVAGVARAKRVFAGDARACAVLVDGTLRCWGDNDQGETGGDTSYAPAARELVEPNAVAGVNDVVTVAFGWASTCALSRSGEVHCWGSAITPEMQSGAGYATEKPFEMPHIRKADDIAVGSGILCVTDGGAVDCYGSNYALVKNTPDRASASIGIKNAAKVRIASSHACALTRDARVWCWGYDSSGQLGLPDDPNRAYQPHEPVALAVPSARDVAVSDSMSCAVISPDEVWCVGTWPYSGARPVRVERAPIQVKVR